MEMTVREAPMAFVVESHQDLSKMGTDAHVGVRSDPIPVKYGYIGVCCTMLLFLFVNQWVTARGPPKTVKTDFWKWKNLFISWIHAVIIGMWDLSCFFVHPELRDDMVKHVTPYTYAMVTFSTGYFFYDFLDIFWQGKGFELWEITLHHIAVGGMFFWNVATCDCIGYNVIALMAEINSLFLHSRKLMQIYGISYQHWFYRFICYVNLITFVIGRFFSVGVILYGISTEAHRVSLLYVRVLSAAMLVMVVINVVLFIRLFRSDIIRSLTTKSRPRTEHNSVNKNHLMSNNNVHRNAEIEPKQKLS